MFKIDLNLEPRERFKEVAAYFKADALALFDIYRDLIGEAIGFMFKMLDFVAIEADSEYYQEYEGIADVLQVSTH